MCLKVEENSKKVMVKMLNAEILNLWIKFKVLPKVSTRYCLALILRNRNKKDIRIVNRFIGAKQKQEGYQNSKQIYQC